MNTSFVETSNANDELLPLRQMIVHLADCCALDLADRSAIRHFLDEDFSDCQANHQDRHSRQELQSMIILLFRLEASSSEDIGISGLHELWHQHSEIVTRFNRHETMQNQMQTEMHSV